MLKMRFGSKNEEMHELAVERLNRAQNAVAEYMRVRVDASLNETFDAWEEQDTSKMPAREVVVVADE